MWTDEQLSDAAGLLLSSADELGVQKVEDEVKDGSKETYLVVGDVTYTDPLYVEALEKLVKDGRFTKIDDQKGRAVYQKV
jgi:hypothetical protein